MYNAANEGSSVKANSAKRLLAQANHLRENFEGFDAEKDSCIIPFPAELEIRSWNRPTFSVRLDEVRPCIKNRVAQFQPG